MAIASHTPSLDLRATESTKEVPVKAVNKPGTKISMSTATFSRIPSRQVAPKHRHNCAPDPHMLEDCLKMELAPSQNPCSFLPWIQTECANVKRDPGSACLPKINFPL
ncbi:rCG20475 [Rattus norvegicus]|uniref:RCG20475 n=1 Tax=Rattus norvegicus TaxID=10116 RepID=A6JGL1_RAT|nr:rCG20475 [Rattus norvegicus]